MMCTQRFLKNDQKNITKIFKSSSPEERSRLSAAFFKSKVLPQNSILTYGFLEDPDTKGIPRIDGQNTQGEIDPIHEQTEKLSLKDSIHLVIKERIEPIINIKFNFITDAANADIRITFDENDGAWSLLGTDVLETKKPEPTMNLGWFNVFTTIHEFCHTLGMIHEHQNPRGEQIKWNKPVLYKVIGEQQGWSEETIDQNIINRYNKDDTNGSDFDPKSIMLYFFPSSVTTNGVGTKQNRRYSAEDVIWLEKTYPGGKMSAAEFYQKAYGKTLEEGIMAIKVDREKLEKKGTESSLFDGIWFYLSIFLIAIILGYLLYKYGEKRRPNIVSENIPERTLEN